MEKGATSHKRKKLELFIAIILLVVCGVVFDARVYVATRAEKENGLIAELKSIRTSVETYLLLNKSLPPNLRTLAVQTFTLSGKTRSYIRGIKLDKDSYPVDAFGGRFNYDPETGRVSPSLGKYASW